MSAAFVDSWDAQLECYKTQATECTMAKYVKDMLDGTATQEAAAAMDAEPTMDPTLLKDIVKKQIDCQQCQLQTQINKLKQKLAQSIPPADNSKKPAKNNNRGATAKTPKGTPSTNKKLLVTALKSALKKPLPKTPPQTPPARNMQKNPLLWAPGKEKVRKPETQTSSSPGKHHQSAGEAYRNTTQRKSNRGSKQILHSTLWFLRHPQKHSQAQCIYPPRQLTHMVLLSTTIKHVCTRSHPAHIHTTPSQFPIPPWPWPQILPTANVHHTQAN